MGCGRIEVKEKKCTDDGALGAMAIRWVGLRALEAGG